MDGCMVIKLQIYIAPLPEKLIRGIMSVYMYLRIYVCLHICKYVCMHVSIWLKVLYKWKNALEQNQTIKPTTEISLTLWFGPSRPLVLDHLTADAAASVTKH